MGICCYPTYTRVNVQINGDLRIRCFPATAKGMRMAKQLNKEWQLEKKEARRIRNATRYIGYYGLFRCLSFYRYLDENGKQKNVIRYYVQGAERCLKGGVYITRKRSFDEAFDEAVKKIITFQQYKRVTKDMREVIETTRKKLWRQYRKADTTC